MITRDGQCSAFDDSNLQETTWKDHLIPEGTYIDKVQMLQSVDGGNLLVGLKFYADSKVLLAIGDINHPEFGTGRHTRFSLKEFQMNCGRLIGLKSSGGGSNQAYHYNLQWIIANDTAKFTLIKLF